MKKISVLVAMCGLVLAQIAFAQINSDLISANTAAGMERPRIDPNGAIHEQFLTFDDADGIGDAGTYNPTDSFGFDIYLTYSGYNSSGLSLWLETQTLNNFAGSLSITGFTYGTTFPDVNQLGPNPAPFDVTVGTSPGYRREGRDLGATVAGVGTDFQPHPPGTYFVGHVSLTISGAVPGTYFLKSTTAFPTSSEVTSFDGTNLADEWLPASTYTITVVPEPTPWLLVGFGIVILFGLNKFRLCIARRNRV